MPAARQRLLSSLLLLSFAPIAIGGGVGCGGSTGQNAASQALKTPEMPTDKQSKCHVAKSQAEPLIVEWADTDRARLESLSHKGLVAVHYEGCTLRLLSRCTVKGSGYSYSPVTRRVNKLAIRDEDDLYMKMPFGAAQLEGKLKTAGQLNVQMTTVGRYEAQIRNVFKEDLEGECKDTTHVVYALTVGAFTFSAGSDAEVGAGASVAGVGGGAKSAAARELLQKDGDETACEKASSSNTSPPEGCAGPFQIEVMPLAKGSKPAVVAPVPVPTPAPTTTTTPPDPIVPPPPAPTGSSSSGLASTPKKPPIKCKKGFESIDGGPCVKIGTTKKPAAKPSVASSSNSSSSSSLCGEGQHQVGTRCVDDEPPIPPPPACASGQHQVGTRCVDDEPPPPIVPPPPPTCVAGTHLENGACVVDTQPEPRTSSYHPVYGSGNQTGDDQYQPNPYRTLLWYGVYGFGLTALITGSIAIASAKAANEQCSVDRGFCGPDYEGKRSTAITAAVITDVALGLTALSVVGLILIPSKTKVGIAPTPGGGVAGGVSGKF